MSEDKKAQDSKETTVKATPEEASKKGLELESGKPASVVLLTRKRRFLFSV